MVVMHHIPFVPVGSHNEGQRREEPRKACLWGVRKDLVEVA